MHLAQQLAHPCGRRHVEEIVEHGVMLALEACGDTLRERIHAKARPRSTEQQCRLVLNTSVQDTFEELPALHVKRFA